MKAMTSATHAAVVVALEHEQDPRLTHAECKRAIHARPNFGVNPAFKQTVAPAKRKRTTKRKPTAKATARARG